VLYHEHKVPDKRLRDPFTMRIVLVSGDGGYLRSFKTLLTTYHNLKLEIVVYSWKDKLSNHLAQIPGVRVYYLDDVLANSMKKVPCT
jgi:hypothetical protein